MEEVLLWKKEYQAAADEIQKIVLPQTHFEEVPHQWMFYLVAMATLTAMASTAETAGAAMAAAMSS